jgi:hypothetical protein
VVGRLRGRVTPHRSAPRRCHRRSARPARQPGGRLHRQLQDPDPITYPTCLTRHRQSPTRDLDKPTVPRPTATRTRRHDSCPSALMPSLRSTTQPLTVDLRLVSGLALHRSGQAVLDLRRGLRVRCCRSTVPRRLQGTLPQVKPCWLRQEGIGAPTFGSQLRRCSTLCERPG